MGYRSRRPPPVLRGTGINLSVDEVYELLTGIRLGEGFTSEAEAASAWWRYGSAIMATLVTDDPRVTVVGQDFCNVLPRGSEPWAATRWGAA